MSEREKPSLNRGDERERSLDRDGRKRERGERDEHFLFSIIYYNFLNFQKIILIFFYSIYTCHDFIGPTSTCIKPRWHLMFRGQIFLDRRAKIQTEPNEVGANQNFQTLGNKIKTG